MTRILTSIRQFRSLIPVLLLGTFLAGCKCVKYPVSNSANVILNNPLLTDEAIQQRITQNTAIPPTSVKIKRCPCDSALINITLPDDQQFEGHGGDVAIQPKDRPQSESADINLGTSAVNRILSPLDESQFLGRGKLDSLYRIDPKQLIPIGTKPKDTTKPVSIAVFDSGLNPDFVAGVDWQQSTTLCTANTSPTLVTSAQGWNFMNSPVTASTADDQNVEHGSRVAYFVAKQFGDTPVPVRIIPMKVLGRDNTGDLFSVLCAMETARKNNVEVFNMSLGYYGNRDAVFSQYIKRAVDQGIWIVVAAGNQPVSTEERNLSRRKLSFYPAFFSKEFDRVIAVTTMTGSAVCDGQNFDQDFVVSVKADTVCRFRLLVPGASTNLGVFGTSYATPIVAGWLGAMIRQPGMTGSGVTRQQLIDKMMVSSTPGLYQGRFIKSN